MDMPFRPAMAAPSMHPGFTIRTFAECAVSYIQHGGEARYLPRIIEHIGSRHMTDLFPFDIRQLASEMYPTQTNATRNRCVIMPIRAVFYHAYDRGWAHPIRLRNLKIDRPKRKEAASRDWLHIFYRQADRDGYPHVTALVMFMAQTGARISEAIALRWSEVDLSKKKALLLKTKTDRNSVRDLTDHLTARLYELKVGLSADDRVFRYTSRHAVNERIQIICRHADISYKPSHTCGRHAFANNTLAMGIDIKSVMDAGGWRSTAVFLGVYVNPRNAGRVVADRHNLHHYEPEL